ncbi:hypothetical protein ACVXZ0_14780 [Staphylococcus aureus]
MFWSYQYEAAYQLAERGIKVNLIEMRPVKQTPAHHLILENFRNLYVPISYAEML